MQGLRSRDVNNLKDAVRQLQRRPGLSIVIVAILAAFLGAYAGALLLKKITLRFVQIVVAIGMFVLGAALATGLV